MNYEKSFTALFTSEKVHHMAQYALHAREQAQLLARRSVPSSVFAAHVHGRSFGRVASSRSV